MLRDLIVNGLHLSFSVTNVLDSRYSHPGIGRANSNDIAIAEGGDFVGSEGKNNSELPQPGRAFQLLLSTSID